MLNSHTTISVHNIRKQYKENDMRVSDLQPAAWPKSPSVENPNSDSHRLFTNDFNKQSFIEAHGDVEIVWNERYKHWEVPAFAESRKAYCDAKQRYCEQHGSE